MWQEEARTTNYPKGPSGAWTRRQENGGWKTTSYYPHQSGGRGDGTWDKLWKQGHTTLSEAQHDRWTAKGYHLGTNKKVFDAGLYAIYRTVMRFGKRREHDHG